MPEQPTFEAAKYVGTVVAALISGITAVRLAIKGRNSSHNERITLLEATRREDRRVMVEIRTQLEEVNVQLESNERRIRKVEVNQHDFDREVRDNLQRMIDQIDRRLSHPVDRNQKTA